MVGLGFWSMTCVQVYIMKNQNYCLDFVIFSYYSPKLKEQQYISRVSLKELENDHLDEAGWGNVAENIYSTRWRCLHLRDPL